MILDQLSLPFALRKDATLAHACVCALSAAAWRATDTADPLAHLLGDRVAREAAYTLQQMAYSPEAVEVMVGVSLYDVDCHVRLLAKHVSLSLLSIITEATVPATPKVSYAH